MCGRRGGGGGLIGMGKLNLSKNNKWILKKFVEEIIGGKNYEGDR